jgi:hypothetical protein
LFLSFLLFSWRLPFCTCQLLHVLCRFTSQHPQDNSTSFLPAPSLNPH